MKTDRSLNSHIEFWACPSTELHVRHVAHLMILIIVI